MMNDDQKVKNNWAVHTIIILFGTLIIVSAYFLPTGSPEIYRFYNFLQSLLLNIGSNLIVITFIFGVFQFYGIRDRENAATSAQNIPSVSESDEDLRGSLASRSAVVEVRSPNRLKGVTPDDTTPPNNQPRQISSSGASGTRARTQRKNS